MKPAGGSMAPHTWTPAPSSKHAANKPETASRHRKDQPDRAGPPLRPPAGKMLHNIGQKRAWEQEHEVESGVESGVHLPVPSKKARTMGWRETGSGSCGSDTSVRVNNVATPGSGNPSSIRPSNYPSIPAKPNNGSSIAHHSSHSQGSSHGNSSSHQPAGGTPRRIVRIKQRKQAANAVHLHTDGVAATAAAAGAAGAEPVHKAAQEAQEAAIRAALQEAAAAVGTTCCYSKAVQEAYYYGVGQAQQYDGVAASPFAAFAY